MNTYGYIFRHIVEYKYIYMQIYYGSMLEVALMAEFLLSICVVLNPIVSTVWPSVLSPDSVKHQIRYVSDGL